MIFAFDLDGTLEPFGGPIPFSVLVALHRAGHRLSTAGDSPGIEQQEQWEANGAFPDFILSKDELRLLLILEEPIICIDDDERQRPIAEKDDMLFLSPEEFMSKRHMWLPWREV